jgi:hypothetical protein
MAEIEMPPQDARGDYKDPYDTQGHVQEALVIKGHQRVTDWVTQVTLAVTEFQHSAEGHIDQLEYDHEAHVEFAGVLSAFASAVSSVIPGHGAAVELAKAVGEGVADLLLDGLQSSFNEHMDGTMTGAKMRLKGSVHALVLAVTEHASHAYDGIDERLRKAIDEGMTYVDSSSMDDAYLASMLDWLGFTQPTRANTLDPVRQALENEFFGVYQAVRNQLAQAQGIDTYGQGPNQWEHDAIQHERELYKEEGERAWDDAYRE